MFSTAESNDPGDAVCYAPAEHELHEGAPRTALHYWNRCRGGREMPVRDDLRPMDIADILPFVFLVDVLPGASNYRYRLIGTMIAEWSGDDATGRTMDDPRCGSNSSALIALHDDVIRTRAPVLTVNRPALFDGSTLLFDRILLPLAGEDGDIAMIVGVAAARPVSSEPAWTGMTPCSA